MEPVVERQEEDGMLKVCAYVLGTAMPLPSGDKSRTKALVLGLMRQKGD